jgi:exosome complex component RRP41
MPFVCSWKVSAVINRRPESLFVDGRRLDGRALDALGTAVAETGIIPQADGSAKVERSGTKVLATVRGPHEPQKHEDDLTHVRCTIDVPSFSGPVQHDDLTERMEGALCSLVLFDDLPGCVVDVRIQLVASGASVLATALAAATLALADAGVPMRDLVAAVDVVIVHDAQGKRFIALDPSEIEGTWASSTITVCFTCHRGDLVLLCANGRQSQDELESALTLAARGMGAVSDLMTDSFLRRYATRGEDK